MNKSRKAFKMDYIAPVSLWLVVCEYDLPEGHVVEAASVGCNFHDSRLEHHCESGPILFTSRIHAGVYAHVANSQGAQNNMHTKGDWRVIPLLDFNLRELVRVKGGTVRCMLSFAMTMSESGALIVANGAPRVLCAVHSFSIADNVTDNIVFSFEKPLKTVLNEWAAMGLSAFEDELGEFDGRDPAAIAQAVERAITQAPITAPGFDSGACGVYSPVRGRWFVAADCKVFAIERTLH